MKFVIASDIHGSAYYCEKLLQRFTEEKADKLILLGDLLYHGPRNPLPAGYEPARVFAALNALDKDILSVRGNCDSEVDQTVLSFPITAEYGVLFFAGRTVYFTHGHLYDKDRPLPMKEGDILLSGHTHIQECEERAGRIFINPGSVALPKEGSKHGYLVLDENGFFAADLESDERVAVYPFN